MLVKPCSTTLHQTQTSTDCQAYQGDLGLDESLMSDSYYHTLREARIAEVKEELDRILSQARWCMDGPW